MNNEKIIKDYLNNDLKLTDKRVQQEYNNMHKYVDIEKEFVDVILHGFNDNLLTIEEYNAKILHENYPLSILGAYNYLISLRENPKEALDYLNQGLPRK